MAQDREQRIREKAHALWEKAGRPEGQEVRHWQEAEKLVDEADSLAAQTAKNPKREPRNR
jgi:hypothetical protein